MENKVKTQVEHTVDAILELFQIIPTDDQLNKLKEIISDVHNDGYAEAQIIYDRETW